MPFLLSLLGVGKYILNFIGIVLKGVMAFAGKHPLLFLAILLDVALLYGCYRGYQWHQKSDKQAVQIVDLKKTVKEKDSLIELLYQRVKEYATALTDAQQGRVRDIEDHNKAVEALRKAAEAQLARAQIEAAKTREQRDYYFQLSEKYRKAGPNCGTAEARIKCEEALNGRFIQDIQKVKR